MKLAVPEANIQEVESILEHGLHMQEHVRTTCQFIDPVIRGIKEARKAAQKALNEVETILSSLEDLEDEMERLRNMNANLRSNADYYDDAVRNAIGALATLRNHSDVLEDA
jgi:predicted  nucleic acid-binding Zn-ribbon protein